MRHLALGLLIVLGAVSATKVTDTGDLPTFSEVVRSITDDLKPNDGVLSFFYVVPVVKKDIGVGKGVLVQAAQAVDQETGRDRFDSPSFTPEMRGYDSSTDNGFTTDDLNNIFLDPSDQPYFNYDVPVIVPLDIHFHHSLHTKPKLSRCQVDSRTWREEQITEILGLVGNPDIPKWNHNLVNKSIRKLKDLLASYPPSYLTNKEDLTELVITWLTCFHLVNSYFDSYDLFNSNILDTLTRGHLPLLEEFLDTYKLLSEEGTIISPEATSEKIPGYKTLPAYVGATSEQADYLVNLIATVLSTS